MPEVTGTEQVAVTADSGVTEILANSPDALAEKAGETEQSDETGEVEKAQPDDAEAESDESGDEPDDGEDTEADTEEDAVDDDGNPIPYKRFKSVNDKKNEAVREVEKLKETLDKYDSVFKDPDVLRVYLKKQGYSDEGVNKYLTDNGITESVEPKNEEYDLSTTEGWQKFIQSEISKAITPVKQELTSAQRLRQQQEVEDRLRAQTSDAQKLAKEVFGIEYGDEAKDINNPKTAVGKIMKYLNAHPEKREYVLKGDFPKADILRLAMSEEGFKHGEQKGREAEKERVKKLKTVAMEDDNKVSAEDMPNADWSPGEILEWRRKHPDVS